MNTNERPQDLSPEKIEDLEDLENAVDSAVVEDGEFESESEKRVENWKKKQEEEKIEIVKEKKEKIEKDLREDVQIPEDIMKETKKLREYQEGLKQKNKEFLEEREDMVKKIQSQLDGGVNISDLDLGDRGEFKNVLSSFRNVAKNTLNIEKADYYLEAGENELGDLLDTHEDREITMEALEKIAKQINDFEKYLEELENMTAEQLEGAEGEVRGLLDRLDDIYNKNPELFKKLLIAGAVIGVLILAYVVLGPAVAGMYEWALATSPDVVSGAVGATKALLSYAGKGGAITAGAVVGGGILLKVISLLKDEKFRDDFAKGACGVSGFPWWYKFLGGKEANASDNK